VDPEKLEMNFLAAVSKKVVATPDLDMMFAAEV
jgi:hypothetical protein